MKSHETIRLSLRANGLAWAEGKRSEALRVSTLLGLMVGLCCLGISSPAAGNLLENGDFENEQNPLAGWTVDYAWSGNQWYVDNRYRVSVLPMEQGRVNVVKLVSEADEGTKMESRPIPFDAGYRYTCTMEIKGGPFRAYFAGYKWKPGIRPHEAPGAEELRPVFKGKADVSKAGSWRRITFDFPAKKLTDLGRQHLEAVRFVTVYVWVERTGYVDNVTVTRVKDAAGTR